MKNSTLNKKNQQGIALVSAVMIIMIFAIMGMMNVQKAKESERMAGSIVRYDTVFEAAEQSLRNAGNYLLSVRGTPYVGTGSNGKNTAKNFDTSQIDDIDLVMDPDSAIVWNRTSLADEVCGSGACKAGINFVTRQDSKELWVDLAIKSDFGQACSTPGANEISCNNYLRDIETYTVIEQLRSDDGDGGGDGGVTAMQGSAGFTGTGYETYYLITVKGSGFPPGTSDDDKESPYNTRENIILQGVFARL